MKPSREETLRYLGWRGQTLNDKLARLVDDCISECADMAKPRHITGRFDLDYSAECIRVRGTSLLLTGDSIRDYLAGAEKTLLFAATLGQEIDGLIRRYSYTDMTRSAILDAAATALIEAYCDEEQGQGCPGDRFSPGYGDLPISLQPQLLDALNASNAIGLTCNQAFMLNPAKSVTAVIATDSRSSHEKCHCCPQRGTCPYHSN